MGASLVVALKLCGGRGVYEGRKLAELHDPRPRHRLPSAAVSAEKRSMSKEAKIAKTGRIPTPAVERWTDAAARALRHIESRRTVHARSNVGCILDWMTAHVIEMTESD